MSKKDDIRQKAVQILSRPENKSGMRFTALLNAVSNELEENLNTCNGSLYNFPKECPEKVSRPYRGLFILKENEQYLKDLAELGVLDEKTSEADIYEPAKNYLLGKEECSHAVVIGGNTFGKKWGTPDILGSIRASSDAVYQPALEIIAVEVKNAGYSPVEALGQAMAYKLFAHRTWLILPEDSDLDRIEGIAMSANIGLISFTEGTGGYSFTTLNRPVSGYPDFNEVNRTLDDLKKKDKKSFNILIKNEID